MDVIEAFLDNYEFGELRSKYLRPEKQSGVAGPLQTLNLERVDLRQYSQMASDSFHDVALTPDIA